MDTNSFLPFTIKHIICMYIYTFKYFIHLPKDRRMVELAGEEQEDGMEGMIIMMMI